MKFKYYDLLSHMVPGLVVFWVLSFEYEKFMPNVSAIPLLAIAFIIGYFVNTLGSWFESFFHAISGGNPLEKFFDGEGIWKVKYHNGEVIKSLISSRLANGETENSKLFVEAMRIANSDSTARLEDFNASYAFSRSIVMTIMAAGGIMLYSDPTNLTYYAIVFCLVLISLLRFRQRNGYYIREVLNISQLILEKEES